MKSSTVWHGHSTRPSLPAGTARKARGNFQVVIMPPAKKNRAFPTGNALLYISLSSVVFGRGASYSGAHPVFVLPLIFLAHGSQPHSSNIPPGHRSESDRIAQWVIIDEIIHSDLCAMVTSSASSDPGAASQWRFSSHPGAAVPHSQYHIKLAGSFIVLHNRKIILCGGLPASAP